MILTSIYQNEKKNSSSDFKLNKSIELKLFDDSPTKSFQEFEKKHVGSSSYDIQYNIYNINNIISIRKRTPKSPHLYHFREPLFTNFKNIAMRAHPQHPIVALIEAFFEAYINTFTKEANAQITLFQPYYDSKPNTERILKKAALKELHEKLTIHLKILQNKPKDLVAKRQLRKTLLKYGKLIASTDDPEILKLLNKLDEYL